MLRVENLEKTFVMAEGKVAAVRDVSFEVQEGTFLTLLGPSGCGKTTTLRCVAGLEHPDRGRIAIGDMTVFSGSDGILVPAYRRGVGMVFQSYAIWPHMTVAENVAFPLVHGGFRVPKSEVKQRVTKALELVGLAKQENRPAPLLSGGQQQRVSLARALVYEPKLLLLDEPLSNLDAKLREEMRLELRDLVKRLKVSTLYVTHDQEEALVLSDEIAVMSEGRILQKGSPREIYLDPRHPFVANFVGNANFIEGSVESGKNGQPGFVVGTALGQMSCRLPSELGKGERVSLMFRPEDVLIHTAAQTSKVNLFPGVLERSIFVGSKIQCEIRSGTLLLHSEANARTEIEQSSNVFVEVPPDCIRVLRA
ncbi:MAG: ABC transporter ATP-binding protein [Candidatus Binatia bacterium]